MNINHTTCALRIMLSIVMFAIIAVLAGCERTEQTAITDGELEPVGQPAKEQKPLGQVMEFEGFTLRANVIRADFLSETMIEQYGIEPQPNLALLNLVILDNQSEQQPATVRAEVTAQQQNLLDHINVIEMRLVEADGYVSYIGTLEAGAQRIFQLTIKAQPADTDQLLEMNFEVRLDW